MNDLYIYYQVTQEHAAALELRVRAMQARLAGERGVNAQLKRRPEAADGLQTWMEIYPGTAAGFDAALDAAVQDAALAELIAGKRHIEIFTDLHPCA
ncbi:DUF4936 family protein [Massilia sp. TWR1-2-2]|uniref:DUF4936 family protein n=1 Tax=Massilia sp. TWR1-2-2 TaxID=2804584 RepID=UPI003CF36261